MDQGPGVEASYDKALRGNAWRTLVSRGTTTWRPFCNSAPLLNERRAVPVRNTVVDRRTSFFFPVCAMSTAQPCRHRAKVSAIGTLLSYSSRWLIPQEDLKAQKTHGATALQRARPMSCSICAL